MSLLDPTIQGHPSIEGPNYRDQAVVFTVCCECGRLRTVLWLKHDRWYCSACKASGENRPTMIPLKG